MAGQVPSGFKQINAHEVWENDKEVVILGEVGGDKSHNCDEMGCGSLGWHVLRRIKKEKENG